MDYHLCVFNARLLLLSVTSSLCSLHGSTPTVPALGTTGACGGTDINTATNPCGCVPYAPLLMTVLCLPTVHTARCRGANLGGKNFSGSHTAYSQTSVLIFFCTWEDAFIWQPEGTFLDVQRRYIWQMLSAAVSFHAPLSFLNLDGCFKVIKSNQENN